MLSVKLLLDETLGLLDIRNMEASQ